MISLIKRDLKLNFATKASVIFLIIFFPFLILIMEINDIERIYPFMILSYGYILTSMPFRYDARKKTDLLIQSLPINKRDVVISKYISALINYLIALSYTWLVLNIFDLTKLGIGVNLNLNIIKETVFIFTLISSISLPAYLRLPPKLANVVNVIIYITILNIFVFMPGDRDITNIVNMMSELSNNGFLTIAILGIIYFLSMGISIFLYETRDLN